MHEEHRTSAVLRAAAAYVAPRYEEPRQVRPSHAMGSSDRLSPTNFYDDDMDADITE